MGGLGTRGSLWLEREGCPHRTGRGRGPEIENANNPKPVTNDHIDPHCCRGVQRGLKREAACVRLCP